MLKHHKRLFLSIIFFLLFVSYNCVKLHTVKNNDLNYNLHTFYYAWYGNKEIDGSQRHWNHEVLPHWSNNTWNDLPDFPGGDDIGANFYPKLGYYSSNDLSTISKHINMIKRAGIGVITLSWWGENTFEDKNVKLIMDIADAQRIKVSFHLEPTKDRTAEKVVEMIKYILDNYGNHNSFYRFNGKPLFYVYDSYHIEAKDWATILSVEGEKTIRGTYLDSYIIGLWVHKEEEDYFINGNFDGIYTYFASDGFTYGSSSKNWNYLSEWAVKNKKLFIPCVGPGYSDSRIRPWNTQNFKSRNEGKYYDSMFESAIASNPSIIGITSFNEWHEGTQIEPAIQKKIKSFDYENYYPLDENYYLNRTFYWSKQFLK